MIREQLCEKLRSRWYLTTEEIDAILADRDFFHPYLKNALAHRARLGYVAESPKEDLRLLYGDSLIDEATTNIA